MRDENLPAVMRLDQLFGYHLRRASNAAMAELTQLLSHFGLRPTLYAILAAIEATPGATQSDIGRRLAIQRANMVPLLAELESAGWVERAPAPNDRRSRILSIAPTRRAELAAIHAAVQANDRELAARVGGSLDQLKTILARVWSETGEGR